MNISVYVSVFAIANLLKSFNAQGHFSNSVSGCKHSHLNVSKGVYFFSLDRYISCLYHFICTQITGTYHRVTPTQLKLVCVVITVITLWHPFPSLQPWPQQLNDNIFQERDIPPSCVGNSSSKAESLEITIWMHVDYSEYK